MLSNQCYLKRSETTLDKKITSAMLAEPHPLCNYKKIVIVHIWEIPYQIKTESYLNRTWSIWTTLNRTVTSSRLAKDV